MNPPSGGAKTANLKAIETRELVADHVSIGRHPTSRSILPFAPGGGLFVRTGYFFACFIQLAYLMGWEVRSPVSGFC